MLLALVNAALDAQSSATRNDIFKRWSASSGSLLTDRKPQLSPREENWLREHPVMRVVVNDTAAPLTFLDGNGRLRGIVADLLELIRLRTGLRFDIGRASGDGDMIDQLESGRTDIIATLSTDTRPGNPLQLSRPYLQSAYVLVSRDGNHQPANLKQLKGKRLRYPATAAWPHCSMPSIH
jgi:two-component system sensor histidine kinase EvgS